MRRILERCGFRVGEPTVCAMVGEELPHCLVRDALAQWKKHERKKEARRRAASRVSLEPIAGGVLWSLDGAWIGRCLGQIVRAEIVLDVATRRTVGTEVTLSATGEEVVRLLELARMKTGTVPIVLVFDNGPENVNAVVAAWCEFHGVLIVRSVPRTPQHNPWAERRIGEVKRVSGLDAPVALESLSEARVRLLDAVTVLDEHLVRPVLGNKTAREADTKPWVEYAPSQRAQLLERVAIARDQARARLAAKATHRQVRRAEREAALDVLEDAGLIIKTVGGKPSVRAARGQEAGVRAPSLSLALGVVQGGPQGAGENSSPSVVVAVETAGSAIAGSAAAVEPVRANNGGPASRRSRTRSGRPRISRSPSPRSVELVESGKNEAFPSQILRSGAAATAVESEGECAPHPVSRAPEPLCDASKSDPLCASPASLDAPCAPYARFVESRRCAPAPTRALGVARAIEYPVRRAAGPVLDTGQGVAKCPVFFPRGGVPESHCDTGKNFVCITKYYIGHNTYVIWNVGGSSTEDIIGSIFQEVLTSRVPIPLGDIVSNLPGEDALGETGKKAADIGCCDKTDGAKKASKKKPYYNALKWTYRCIAWPCKGIYKREKTGEAGKWD